VVKRIWTIQAAGVLLLSLLVRLLYLLDSSAGLTYDTPIIDSYTYHKVAESLVRGEGLTPEFFWQPVFYPTFLALAYAVGGSSIAFARLLQLLIGVVTCALTYRLGTTVFDRRAGVVAATIVALYGPVIFFEGELLATGWACSWSVALVLLLLRCGKTVHPLLSLAAGVCGALGVLTRPTFLPFLAAACIWLVLAWRRKGLAWPSVAAQTSLVLAGFLAVSLPVAWQSLEHSERFSILPASSGVNLYIGNNPNAANTVAIRPGADWENLTRLPESHGIVRKRDTSGFFRGKVLEYVRTDPVGFASGLALKAVQFVSSREIPRNVDAYVHRKGSPTLTVLLWKVGGFGFPFGVLLPLTLIGLAATWRRLPGPVLLFLLLYPAAIVLVFVSARYRVPIVPVMAVVSAGGVFELARWFRDGRRRQVLAAMVGLVAVVILSVAPGPFPQETTDYEAELRYLVGRRVMERGDLDRAVELLGQAVALDPAHSDAHNSLGVAYVRRGNLALAARHYDQAVRNNPQSVTARTNLGRVLTARLDFGGAVRQFRLALEQRPDDPEVHYHLGVVLSRQRKFEEALFHFSRSLEVRPGHADTLNESGRALYGQGKPVEAAKRLQAALLADPLHRKALDYLAIVLTDLGRQEEVIPLYRSALERARKAGDADRARHIEERLKRSD